MRALVFAALLALAGGATQAQTTVNPRPPAPAPKVERLDYTVTRNGDRVGTHSVTINREGDSVRALIATDIRVRVLGITVYRFAHRGEEEWRNGHLAAMKTETDDDGTPDKVDLSAANGVVKVTRNGAPVALPPALVNGAVVPASLWHERIPGTSTLLDPQDARVLAVTSRFVGDETVSVGGRQVMTKHYAVTGDVNRDLWYDASGVPVQVRFAHKDGSVIQFSLNR